MRKPAYSLPKQGTIGSLVVKAVVANKGTMPSKAVLAKQVKAKFAKSRWQTSHYTWYKYQLLHANGRYSKLLKPLLQGKGKSKAKAAAKAVTPMA